VIEQACVLVVCVCVCVCVRARMRVHECTSFFCVFVSELDVM
jgi:hypothetical protein